MDLERVAGQAGGSSLEWLPWGFLSICEFSAKKNTGRKEQLLTIEDGKLKTANEFENISSGQNSLKPGRTLISRKFQKLEKPSISPKVCVSPKGLQELAQLSIQRRIHGSSSTSKSPTSVDLGRTRSGWPISWENAFGTPSQEKITIAKATTQVFLNHRAAMVLLPKPILPGKNAPLLGGGAVR